MITTLYVDVATSSFWNFDDKDPISKDQPHLVRLAFLLIEGGVGVAEISNLIKMPDGVRMSEKATIANGINDHKLHHGGYELPDVLNQLSESVAAVLRAGDEGQIVAFSWQFSRHVLDISYRRCGFHLRPWSIPIYDLMHRGSELVGKQHKRQGTGFAFPKFDELCERTMGHTIRPSHNPKVDGLVRVRSLLTMHDACLDWERQHAYQD